MKKLIALLITFAMLVSLVPFNVSADSGGTITQEEAYWRIMAMQEDYPTGTPWSNDNMYFWQPQNWIPTYGYGCAGFAFLLSDAAFGDLPPTKLTNFSYNDVKVGNILRTEGNSHSVVVLEVQDDGIVIEIGRAHV